MKKLFVVFVIMMMSVSAWAAQSVSIKATVQNLGGNVKLVAYVDADGTANWIDETASISGHIRLIHKGTVKRIIKVSNTLSVSRGRVNSDRIELYNFSANEGYDGVEYDLYISCINGFLPPVTDRENGSYYF